MKSFRNLYERMKNIYIFLLILIFHGQSFAQYNTLQFDQKEIPELLVKAKTSNKFIFVDVTAVWCGPCKKMEMTTFKDSSVSAFFNENFICKKFDLDALYKDSISNRIKNNTSGVPKFYFLDNKGNTVLVDGGLKSNSEFIEMGKKAKSNSGLAKELNLLDLRYSEMKKDKSFLINYMKVRNQSGKKIGNILNDYLFLIPAKDFLKESVINIIIENEDNIDGNGYKIISNSKNHQLAKVLNNKPMISYEMYKASLDIIRNEGSYAIRIKDRRLLEKCLNENIRVMQNKDEAKKMNESILKMFDESTKKIQ